nr:uncharacterized protein LOC127303837 [Lolium perenne]
MIKELIRIGSQFIGYREYASRTEEKLAEANKLADTLAQKLEQSEAARKKAELVASEAKAEANEAKAKAASVEELQKRLEDTETALNEHKAAQATREKGILKRLNSQNQRFQAPKGPAENFRSADCALFRLASSDCSQAGRRFVMRISIFQALEAVPPCSKRF